MSRRTLPSTSFSMSSRSSIRRLSRWLFLWAIAIMPLARSGRGPAMPPATRPREPLIEVSGVRSSWLTVDTNSVFMRSMRLRSVMSDAMTMKPSRLPSGRCSGLLLSSTQKLPPTLRLARSSTWKRTTLGHRGEDLGDGLGIGILAVQEHPEGAGRAGPRG